MVQGVILAVSPTSTMTCIPHQHIHHQGKGELEVEFMGLTLVDRILARSTVLELKDQEKPKMTVNLHIHMPSLLCKLFQQHKTNN